VRDGPDFNSRCSFTGSAKLVAAEKGGANRNQPDNRNNNIGFRVASTLCAAAGGITVPPGGQQKRSGPFMMITVGARVEMGARYRGSACPGRRAGSGRRSRLDAPCSLGRSIRGQSRFRSTGITCRVGKGALFAPCPRGCGGWWARFALPTLPVKRVN
jgi:hypothetical protein